MESKPTNVEELFQKLKDYAEVRMQLFKLKAINRVSGLMSSFVSVIILIILFSMAIIFISIAVALLIGEWLGHNYYGFFIVAAIYVIIGLIIYTMRDKLIKGKVASSMIKEMID
jgi:membrane protein insertase Oxa1/YidC/SpoIIIJ